MKANRLLHRTDTYQLQSAPDDLPATNPLNHRASEALVRDSLPESGSFCEFNLFFRYCLIRQTPSYLSVYVQILEVSNQVDMSHFADGGSILTASTIQNQFYR